jgi:hypothetical protein
MTPTLSRQFRTFLPEAARGILEGRPSGSTRRKSPWSGIRPVHVCDRSCPAALGLPGRRPKAKQGPEHSETSET